MKRERLVFARSDIDYVVLICPGGDGVDVNSASRRILDAFATDFAVGIAAQSVREADGSEPARVAAETLSDRRGHSGSEEHHRSKDADKHGRKD